MIMEFFLDYEKTDEDDFYRILGCSQTSTPEQIVTEYRARILDCHPDKQLDDPTAGDRFSKLQKAKDVLTDPDSRKKYDLWRNSGIAIPYTRWCAHSKTVHSSMHWATRQPQPMLNSSVENCQASGVTTKTNKAKDFNFWEGIQIIEEREAKWDRNQPSETLQKFRNYEI